MSQHNRPVPSQGLNIYSGASSQKDGSIFASASRGAATYVSNEYFNPDAKGLRLYIDITVNAGGTGTVTAKVQSKDPVSGNWVDQAGMVTSALSAIATTTLTIYPGVTETANVDVAENLGTQWRVSVTVGTQAVTFSIGGEYLY
jgi:hypothetical protein